MASKLLIGAAVGVVVGVGAALLLIPKPQAAITWGVVVGPTPNRLSLDPVELYSPSDRIQWRATPSTKALYIETEQQIFAASQPSNGRFRVRCTGGPVCDSLALLPALPPYPSNPPGYKYWQGLGDPGSPPSNTQWADGRIIIKW